MARALRRYPSVASSSFNGGRFLQSQKSGGMSDSILGDLISSSHIEKIETLEAHTSTANRRNGGGKFRGELVKETKEMKICMTGPGAILPRPVFLASCPLAASLSRVSDVLFLQGATTECRMLFRRGREAICGNSRQFNCEAQRGHTVKVTQSEITKPYINEFTVGGLFYVRHGDLDFMNRKSRATDVFHVRNVFPNMGDAEFRGLPIGTSFLRAIDDKIRDAVQSAPARSDITETSITQRNIKIRKNYGNVNYAWSPMIQLCQCCHTTTWFTKGNVSKCTFVIEEKKLVCTS
ncbi:hypothetical protein HN011_000617 [Eciton burchellii]|nr:hypothetical protein HN011_000617 [Eciton burchellii]